MTSILEIPEVRALDGPSSLIRIPNQIDVPVTPRLMRLIDSPEFQRLTRISQLGMVSFVYPAANHNRFEHSLGVYRNALLFLKHFSAQPAFTDLISAKSAEVFILAALLHDIGHWPYCHPIEDIKIEGLPTHENFSEEYLRRSSIADCLKEDWDVEPQAVIDLINRKKLTPAESLLCSMLSGPIDIDKMDYLYRDSLHAGVPYGQNFDVLRLIRSLTLNEQGDRLAITNKGRTAAELMVFARYVMFSEVYWHHAVRSATAMFQRAFFLWHEQNFGYPDFERSLSEIFELSEHEMVARLKTDCDGTPAAPILERLFGASRKLYKRVASYSSDENAELFEAIAHKPYAWLMDTSRKLTMLIGAAIDKELSENDILIDAPPVGLEVQFNVEVYYSSSGLFRELGDVSPVVKTLAQKQFDDFVKQVRVFVAPEIVAVVKDLNIDELLTGIIQV